MGQQNEYALAQMDQQNKYAALQNRYMALASVAEENLPSKFLRSELTSAYTVAGGALVGAGFAHLKPEQVPYALGGALVATVGTLGAAAFYGTDANVRESLLLVSRIVGTSSAAIATYRYESERMMKKSQVPPVISAVNAQPPPPPPAPPAQ